MLALIFAACDGGGASTTNAGSDTTTTIEQPADATTTTTVAATTTTEAVTTTAEETVMIPDPSTGVTLVPYSDENITAGDVFLYWYRDGDAGNYLALYAGPGIAGAAGQALCPGNSIAAPDFLHISNTPVEDGSCEGFTTATAEVQVCSGHIWIYRTAIPGDLEGTLYGSLEWNAADGTVKGLTSQFPTDSDIASFEFGRSLYTLWSGFTSDGSSEITCGPPSS